jgi:CDP-diacylglycerol pyrophosphatase
MNIRLLLAALIAFAAFAPAVRAADPDALWKIISEKCLPNERDHGQPAPCAVVDRNNGVEKGYVVLKDREGDTQYLVMPTAKITGIEDQRVIAPGAANYFADAWSQRQFTVDAAKTALPPDTLSLAVNSPHGRSQNQLHIHIDCLRPDVRAAIERRLTAIGDKWAPFPEPLVGHPYRAIRVADLDNANPFTLLAEGVPGARDAMGNHTLAVVGIASPGNTPGFVILDGQFDAAAKDFASSEELQDHSCALAHQ